MPHLFLPSLTEQSKQFSVEGQDAHHWVRVLRLSVGDNVSLVNGKGLRFTGQVSMVDTPAMRFEGNITEVIVGEPAAYELHLIQGLPRGTKFDFVIEKAIELGAASITPFLSQKNPVRVEPEDRDEKQQRWQRLVTASVKQSGHASGPEVRPLLSFAELVKSCQNSFVLLLDPLAKKESLKTVIQSKIPARDIFIIVGPESGLMPQEITKLKEVGCHAVSLGTRVLRTETAGLALLSILNYELDLL